MVLIRLLLQQIGLHLLMELVMLELGNNYNYNNKEIFIINIIISVVKHFEF